MNITNGIITEIVERMGNASLTVEYGQGEVIRLLIDEGTTILNSSCEELMWSDLGEGAIIDARVSDAMTRSIPPQAMAYLIRLIREAQPDTPTVGMPPGPGRPGGSGMPPGSGRPGGPGMPPGAGRPGGPGVPPGPGEVTTGRIWNIDRNNRRFDTITGQDFSSLTRFNVPEDAKILNRMGRPMDFSGLMIGMRVQVRHGNFMTASIPPQTTAYEVRVL